jgi:hypothetical protein
MDDAYVAAVDVVMERDALSFLTQAIKPSTIVPILVRDVSSNASTSVPQGISTPWAAWSIAPVSNSPMPAAPLTIEADAVPPLEDIQIDPPVVETSVVAIGAPATSSFGTPFNNSPDADDSDDDEPPDEGGLSTGDLGRP